MATSESVSGCAKVWEALLDLSVGSLGTGGADTFRYCLQNSSMPLTPLELRPFPSAGGGNVSDSIPHHPLLLGQTWARAWELWVDEHGFGEGWRSEVVPRPGREGRDEEHA